MTALSKGDIMKKYVLIMATLSFAAFLTGCNKSFWGGAATGAVGAGAGYELRARQQAEKLEEDYEAGRISKEQYEERREQLERQSIFY